MSKEIITNSGCNIISNEGCFIVSFLNKCTTLVKIIRVNISDYIKHSVIRITKYLP